jgi:hypothetical protein
MKTIQKMAETGESLLEPMGSGTPHSPNARNIRESYYIGDLAWGPFKLLGGGSKGHPNQDDLARAKSFAENLKKRF